MTATTPAHLPVLLLHGWTGSHQDFGPVRSALEHERLTLVPDLPGHGDQKPAEDGDYSLPAHVRWLREYLDDHGVGDFHLVGHSHGGLVAQWLAFAMPHRVASLTLIGTGPGAPSDDTTDHIRLVARTLQAEGKDAAWALFAEPGDRATEDERDRFVRERFMAMDDDAVVGVARNLLTVAPLGAFLRGIDCPVLVCHGEGDESWLPAQQRRLARWIPGSRYAVIPDADHVPSVENPAGLTALLIPFLRDGDSAPPRSEA
ncbi:alpha/beta fold hydrolase [Euzebya tangerina]|uniref:alpha/beta fold hydrolase n=1 Tax=Euzebya tangerina TaxID=591198 RepID=UPI0013C2AEC8|nr:alpha/beta fold hydrolase [Euzebya tangerina]